MTALQAAIMRGRIRDFEPSNGHAKENPVDKPIVVSSDVLRRLCALETIVAALVHRPAAIEDITPEPGGNPVVPTIAEIKQLVCETYGISVTEIVSHSQVKALAWPRQIAMYLASKLTKLSMAGIGRQFGDRDHTTVLHARNKVTAERAVEPALSAKLARMECKLTGQVT